MDVAQNGLGEIFSMLDDFDLEGFTDKFREQYVRIVNRVKDLDERIAKDKVCGPNFKITPKIVSRLSFTEILQKYEDSVTDCKELAQSDLAEKCERALGSLEQCEQRAAQLKKTQAKKKGEKQKRPVNDDSDDDMVVLGARHNKKDPLTKMDIVNPVKNMNCGHVYEKKTIKSYIADAKKRNMMICQCPVAACGNKKNLNENDLLDFPEFFDDFSDEE